MTIYYVSHAGDNTTGDGSYATPWRRVDYAISQMAAGDTLKLVGGQSNPFYVGYHSSGTAEFSALGNTLTDASATFVTDGFVRAGDFVRWDFTTALVVSVDSETQLTLSQCLTTGSNTYTIEDQSLYQLDIDMPSTEASGVWSRITSYDPDDRSIFIGTASLSTTVNIIEVKIACNRLKSFDVNAESGGKFCLAGVPSGGASDDPCDIDDITTIGGWQGIALGSSDFRACVQNCDLSGFSRVGIYCNAPGCVIQNNYIHDNAQEVTVGATGIFAAVGSEGSIIENNIIDSILQANGVAVTGIRYDGKGGIVRNNTIYNVVNSHTVSLSYAIHNPSASNTLISCYNNIIHTAYEGIYAVAGNIVLCAYNCLYNCTSNYGGAALSGPTVADSDVLEDPDFADVSGGDYTPQNLNVLFGGMPDLENNPTIIGAIRERTPYGAILRQKF
jgi:hypothetical protein